MTVRVGTTVPAGIESGESTRVAAALGEMAAAGVDHAVVGDHVSFFGGSGFDGLVQATALAMLHPTLPVYTAVYLLPLRHPVPVARQLSTLSGLAAGRLTFGVGIGGEDPHEVAVCGVDPRTRGRRMEECLTALRGLLTGEAVTLHGEFVDIEDAVIRPAPTPPIPVVVGGRSEAAIRRAGRLADGWLGVWVTPERFASSLATLAEEADRAGRDGVAWEHGMTVWCGFGPTDGEARATVARAMEGVYHLPFERFERYTPFGSPERVADFLVPYRDAGCSAFNLMARGPSAAATVEAVAEVRRLLASG